MLRLGRGQGLLPNNVLWTQRAELADNAGLGLGLLIAVLGGSLGLTRTRVESIHFRSEADWTFRGGVDVATFSPYWDHPLTRSFGGIIIIE